VTQTLLTDQIPYALNNDDNTVYSMGVRITSDIDGWITHIRMWKATTPNPEPILAALFDVATQAKLTALPDIPLPAGGEGGWVQVELPEPIPVLAGVAFSPAVRTRRYTATTANHVPDGFWPYTNGHLTAELYAGRFFDQNDDDPTVTFPTTQFLNSNYFVDVVFTDVDPSGGAEGNAEVPLSVGVVAVGSSPHGGAASGPLSVSVSAVGSAPHGGSAVVPVNISLAASGARASVGAAVVPVEIGAAASGGRSSLGAAQVPVDVGVSASGLRASSGSAIAPVTVGVTATGNDGDAGRPVKPYPWTPSPVSSYPWTPRPVKSFTEVTG
jgi:hypothetical protein